MIFDFNIKIDITSSLVKNMQILKYLLNIIFT